jgi:hypothetical protein
MVGRVRGIVEEQRFIYDADEASAAVARTAMHARKQHDLTVVDVSEPDSHDPRDVIDAYRGFLAGTSGPFEQQLDELDDVDPADGIFVGTIDGERQVLVGDDALRAVK